MNNKQRLHLLRELKINDINTAFSSHQEWNDWGDCVAPLLKYDQSHYSSFTNSLKYIRIEALSKQTIEPHLHNMVGIVKQAIIELENKIDAYWNPRAIKKIWHDSFWGKLLIGTILICIAFVFKVFIFPLLMNLLPQEHPEVITTNHSVKTIRNHSLN